MEYLQAIARNYFTKSNSEDASNMFQKRKEGCIAFIFEEGLVAYENSDVAADNSKQSFDIDDVNVLGIVIARFSAFVTPSPSPPKKTREWHMTVRIQE